MDPVNRVTRQPAAVPDRARRRGARRGKRFRLAADEHEAPTERGARAQPGDRARRDAERPVGPMPDDESGSRVDVVA